MNMRIATCVFTMILSLPTFSDKARADIETHYSYDDMGNVLREFVVDTDCSPNVALSEHRTKYDNLGRPYEVTVLANPGEALDPTKDRISKTTYDWRGKEIVTRKCASSGNDAVMQYQYDSAGRQTKMIDPTGGVTEKRYDGRGNVIWEKDPLNNVVSYFYDAGGRKYLTRQSVMPKPGFSTTREELLLLDSRGNWYVRLVHGGTVANLKARQYRRVFDSLGRVIEEAQLATAWSWLTEPYDNTVDRVTTYQYDGSSGRVARKTTYAGDIAEQRITEYQYDSMGRLTRETDPEGNVEVRTYDLNSRLETIENTDGNLPDHRFVTYIYDDCGRVLTKKHHGAGAIADIEIEYEYEGLDRVKTATDSRGVVREYSYNGFGEKIQVKDNAQGTSTRVTDYVYDQLGKLTLQRAWDGDCPVFSGAYPTGTSQDTIFKYDLSGRRTKATFPDGAIFSYEYDNGGRLTKRTDPRGQVTDYTHNTYGQPLTKEVNDVLVASFEYDAIGQMTLAQRDTANKVECDYDDFGQRTTETQTVSGVAATVSSEYNQRGELIRLTYPGVASVELTYEYDKNGKVTRISRGGVSLTEYDYEGEYLVERRTRTANHPTEKWIKTKREYNVLRQETDIDNTVGPETGLPAAVLMQYDYEYDAVGTRTRATGIDPDSQNPKAIQDLIYAYDDLYRLTSVTHALLPAGHQSELFNYDILGNRVGDGNGGIYGFKDTRGPVAHTITYDGHNLVNEYTSIDDEVIFHDQAGNLTQDENGLLYEYDNENRLTKISKPPLQP